MVYSDEVWTGIEYQVAAHLIYEDMLKEGLAIVKAVRDRYDGARRNPWNEIECGHHYARAMSSWSLLTALCGFAYSAPDRELRFRPRVNSASFRCLFSTGTSWGGYSQTVVQGKLEARITVEGGALELAALRMPYAGAKPKLSGPFKAAVTLDAGEALIRPATPLHLKPGDTVRLNLSEV